MIGLLPCAGSAQRLLGLPKFMLPLKDKRLCLLTNWINGLIDIGCDKIIIACSPSTLVFMKHIDVLSISDKVCVKDVGLTETMNETILKSLENEVYDVVVMAMPDTVVTSFDKSFVDKIGDNIISCCLWNIRKDQLGKIGQCKINNDTVCDIIDKDERCDYKFGWGVIAFKPPFMKYMSSTDLHPGYSMKKALEDNVKLSYEICKGQYFDCGTVEGYRTYLNYINKVVPIHIKGTIVIVAVYINNSASSYNTLISCLKQLRTIYKNKTIVTVDNMSLNTAWHSTATELDMIILKNDDPTHRYEIGAYKCALNFFRADKYIFIQGTIFLKQKLQLNILDPEKMDVLAFNTLNHLCWSQSGKMFIMDLLKSIKIPCDDNIGVLLWNCFCCNDLFVTAMFINGIFDLPSNTKDHSGAFERILYVFIKHMFGKDYLIKTISTSMFDKHFLNQDPFTM